VVAVVVVVAERVEIGRDAGAFFSDLKFGFLMMHYIRENRNHSLSFFSSSSSFSFTFTVSFSFDVSVQRKDREEERRK